MVKKRCFCFSTKNLKSLLKFAKTYKIRLKITKEYKKLLTNEEKRSYNKKEFFGNFT